MLLDGQGNYFGDKVVLDIIVEDDCSDAVILAEMMDNVDMSLQHENHVDFNKLPQRDDRKSMMHHRVMPVQGASPNQLPGASQ